MTQTPYSVIMNLPSAGNIVMALCAGDVAAVETFFDAVNNVFCWSYTVNNGTIANDIIK